MFKRVAHRAYICSVKLHFDGIFVLLNTPETEPTANKRFYNTIHSGVSDNEEAYYSSGSFAFKEEYKENRYIQEVRFRFPSNDERRAERLARFKKTKFIEMTLNDGNSFIIGRNDIEQNTRPIIMTSSNFHTTEVVMRAESIQSVLRIQKDTVVMIGYDYTYDFYLS